MRILLTRPAPESERTAARLPDLGHTALIAPLLTIEADTGVALGRGPWSAVVMTSGNAARAIAGHPRHDELTGLRCYAVGRQTAQAARNAGFADVVSADGDGADLARLIAGEMGGTVAAPFLYLAGNDRARDLTQPLAQHGLQVETVVIYRAMAAERLPPGIAHALAADEIDAVLHYSRRSAAIFVACARASQVLTAALRPAHVCLSPRAAEPLREIGAARVLVAARPDEQSMLDLIAAS